MFKAEPSFIATLQYLTAEQGGRKTPAFSGYRPQIKFSFNEMQTSGQQIFIDKEIVYPGDSVTAEITIISTQFFIHSLKIDTPFEFREGNRIIGTGIITKLLNKELEAI